MPRRIVLIQGHPDSHPARFCRALRKAYAEGAADGRHALRQLDATSLEFPILTTKEDFDSGAIPETLRPAQDAVAWAVHLAFVYPLWMGGMAALLKAFLEQVMRPGFAYELDVTARGECFPRISPPASL